MAYDYGGDYSLKPQQAKPLITFKVEDSELISMNKKQFKSYECVCPTHDPLGYSEHSTVAKRYQSVEDMQVTWSNYGCEKAKDRDNDFTV